MLKRVLVRREKALNTKHTLTLFTVNSLKILYYKQGRLAKVKAIYKQALISYKKALSTKHTSTLFTVNSLKALYRD